MKLNMLFHKKPETKTQDVDIREAFTLWDILHSKYMTLEKLLIFKSFAHDADLLLVMGKLEKALEKNITILQEQMKTYNIVSPKKNMVAASASASKEVLNDEFIAMEMLLYEQEHAENLLLSIYSTFTNDSIRKIIIDMLMDTIEMTDGLMKYVALRGWVGTPPVYQHLPPETKERLHCGEAGCMWDLLTYRYDTRHFTEIMSSVVHDTDLKLILETGVALLTDQINRLEKELIHFGISLPKRPAEITMALNNKDLWDDSHIYRMTLMGMQGAATLHIRSFKKLSGNQRLRQFMYRLLKEEVEKIHDYIRYGKLKGWLHPVPKFGP